MHRGFYEIYIKNTLEDVLNILETHIIKVEDDIWTKAVAEILAFSCGRSDEVCLCSKERYKNDKLSVFNRVAEEFDSAFSAFIVEKLTIAVVDSDHEPLRDMYETGGITLWHNVDDFIEDTQYYIDEHHEDKVISTCEDAVKYWDGMGYTVVGNNRQK